MVKFKFLFSFGFIIIPRILFGADDSPTNKNAQPDATEYLTNGKYYTPEGKIHFVGSLIGNELTIFFKTLTTDDNLYFKISYCLENLEATCSNGITICYDSMLAKYPQFKNGKLKKMDEIKCDRATDFGFHVYTEQADGMAKYFVLKTSLDKHYYRFEIPDPISPNDPKICFELRMGSKDSIATTITDANGKNLIYTGGPPKKFEPDNPMTLFNVENPNFMNLWLLFLDFMPYYPPQLSFLPRPFVIKGGNKNCKMTAEFNDENINVCKQDREYIGGCETKFLNSSDLECQAELRVSESVEKERGSQETNTDTDGRKKHSQHQFEVGGEIGAEGGWNLFATAKIETKIKSNYAYTWGGENYWEKSSAMTKISALREVEESGKTINMNVHRTDGGPVNFYQSVLKCGGITFRYHKIYAEGDKEHESGPQSTVAYQVLDGQALPLNNQPVDVYFNYNINPKSPKNKNGKGKRLPGDKVYV